MKPGGISWRDRLHSIFGLDVRSLALFRIALGVVLLFDVVLRYQDVHAHYTDEGVLPRNVLPLYNQLMSVHMLDGSLAFQVVLFYLHGFAALALILGWKTRYVLPLAWFLTLSVHGRNSMVLQGGDVLLRLVLFWSMFLPLGACYSLDSLSRSPAPRRIVSMGTVAFLLQVCMVYWFASLLKWDSAWRTDGYALYMALSIGHFTTPLGRVLLDHHSLLSFLTFATIWLESFGPFLLFVPWRNWVFRMLAFVSFLGFHIGIGLTMRMGIFQPVCIAIWFVFLPSEFWDWLGRRLHRTRPAGLKLCLDATDATSRRSVRFWTMLLMVSDLDVAPRPETMREPGWGLIDGQGRIHCGFDAVLVLVRLSPLFWPLAWLAGRKPIRALGAAVNHKGPAPSSATPEPELPPAVVPLGGLVNVLIGLLLLYVFAWNMNSWGEPQRPDTPFVLDRLLDCRDAVRMHFPPQFQTLAHAIGLEQGWGLFAPHPGTTHGWLVVVGKLENGRTVDLLNDGQPVSWDKPEFIADTYRNSRWRQYLMYIMYVSTGDSGVRHSYAVYLAKRWFDEHEDPNEQLQSIEIVGMLETTHPDFKPLTLEKWRLSKLDCRTMLSDLKPVKAAP